MCLCMQARCQSLCTSPPFALAQATCLQLQVYRQVPSLHSSPVVTALDQPTLRWQSSHIQSRAAPTPHPDPLLVIHIVLTRCIAPEQPVMVCFHVRHNVYCTYSPPLPAGHQERPLRGQQPGCPVPAVLWGTGSPGPLQLGRVPSLYPLLWDQ
jgi:hypothetical protein